ncbi:MAG: hypothetical protein GY815_07880, partial [Gammaproteobacteria bacterium]|nr:hypothetical protein [Gammaproteobacteria bacterium]
SADYPTSGNWEGIYFNNALDGASVLDYVDLRYAGNNSSPGDAALYSSNTDLTISNSVISQSIGNYGGVRAYNAALTLTNTELYGHNYGLRATGSGVLSMTGGRVYANAIEGLRFENTATGNISGVEIFGNVTAGMNGVGTGAIVAQGNWWGSPGGPSTGDAVLGNVDYASWLTDGSTYSYYNAGGTNHTAYGLSIANVSGIPATDWGSGAYQSFSYETEANVPLTADFAGLSPSGNYRLILSYWNQDSGSSTQSAVDIDGTVIHSNFTLPTSHASQFEYRLASSSFDAGSLSIEINRSAGLRTVVTGLFLIEDSSADNVAPIVTVDTPTEGELIPVGTYRVSGTATDSTDNLELVEIGIGTGGAPFWQSVTELATDGNWFFNWPVSTQGDYQLQARAIDSAGNQSSSTLINV